MELEGIFIFIKTFFVGLNSPQTWYANYIFTHVEPEKLNEREGEIFYFICSNVVQKTL